MSESIRLAAEAIFVALDVPPPPGPYGERLAFGLENVDIELTLAPDGRTVLMEGSLGQLSTEPLSAGAQLHRLLRAGLAVMGENRAALTLPDSPGLEDIAPMGSAPGTAVAPIRLAAQARIAAGDRQSALRALEDVVQWGRLAADTLGVPSSDPSEPRASSEPVPDDADYVIIHP